MTKKQDYIIKMSTKKVSKKEIEEQKEKVRNLLAKWITEEIFKRNGLEIDNEVELWYACQQADCRPKTSKGKTGFYKKVRF